MKNKNNQRILITIEYDGTNFCGWQSQSGKRCIQSELESVLSKFFGEKIVLFGSGRTDAGVHALNQTAHFDAPIKNNFCVEKLPLAVNLELPEDVKIITAKKVRDNFDARKDVKEKTYVYLCKCSSFDFPIDRKRKMRISTFPDVSKMKECANLFLGEHDFKGFMSSGSSIKTTIRTITRLKITTKHNDIRFEISGNGFLYNMVRIIVGTLLEVGQGKRSITDVKKAIELGNRQYAGRTASACGLYLKSVKY